MNENTEDSKLAEETLIPITLFSRRDRKTTGLINNVTDDGNMKGRSVDYLFEFKDPLFVSKIKIHTDGYNDYHDFKFVAVLDGRGEIVRTCRPTDGFLEIDVEGFCTKFLFKPDAASFISLPKQIRKVEVVGYLKEDFERLEADVFSLNKLSASIETEQFKLDAEKTDFKIAKEDLTSELEEMRESRENLKSEVSSEDNKLSLLRGEISEKEKLLADLSEKVNDRTAERKKINSYVSSLKERREKESEALRAVKRELGQFPTEFAGLAKQGRNSVFVYVVLSLPFIWAICMVTTKLFDNALSFSALDLTEGDFRVLDALLVRIPFVLVAIAIVEVSASIISGFISEIVRINNQRLNMQKVAIIAREVTKAGVDEKDFSEEEEFELETSVKMELLKEHLKGYVSEKFVYKGTLVKRLWDRAKIKADKRAESVIDATFDPVEAAKKEVKNAVSED